MKERLSYVSHVLTLAAAFILFIGVNSATAQVGKITGVITDAQTGEPLSGVQVYLEGTGRGALTGENGRYFLVNVPVGTYTVVAEFLGYATYRIENVFLRIDQTRTIDFQLTPQAIAVEEIRVEAERVPLIDVTSTGSQNTITPEQITALPVNNVEEALSLQQGFLVVPDQTNLISFQESRRNAVDPVRIRGGRAGETSMLIDGIPVNNFLFGSPAVSITPEAIGQIDFIRGGFPAKYGNALSGILNIATKEGSGTNLEGAINYRTGEVGAALGNDHDDVAEFDLFEAYVAGPVPGTEWGADNPRLRFMIAGRRQGGADRALEFDDDVFDPAVKTDVNLNPFLGANFMDVWPGWRGLGFRNSRDLFGKLSYYFTPTAKLNFTVIDYQIDRKPFDFIFLPNYGNPLDSPVIDTQADSVVYFMNRFASRLEPLQFPQVVQNSVEQSRRLYVAAWDHTIGRGAYRLAVGRFDQERKTCNVFQGVCLNDVIDDPAAAFADPNFTDDQFISPKAGTCEIHPTCGTDSFFGGEDLETYVARADAQYQATDHHSLQFGAYYETHDVSMDETQNVGTNVVNIYRLAYSADPWNAAFYVQDRIEYDFVSIDLGLRWDIGKAGGLFFPNPLDPTNGTTALGDTVLGQPGFSSIIRAPGPCIAPRDERWQDVEVTFFNGRETIDTVMSAGDNWSREVCLANENGELGDATLMAAADDMEEAGTRSAVSPRIGVSFPVTANSSFFFNFGRFTQNPLLNNIYVNTGIGKDTTVLFNAASADDCGYTGPGASQATYSFDAANGLCSATSSLEGTPTGVTINVPGEGGPGIVGFPGLEVEKTTLYELGYLAELWDNYAFSLVLFSKDQTGLQGIRTGGVTEGVGVFDPGVTYRSSTPRYSIIVNQDFQTVRGFEISLRRRIVDFWGFDINYAFSRTKTNAAAPEKEFENQVQQNDPRNLLEIASDIDQPQRLSASLFFQMGNETPDGWGWLANSSFSLVGRYESGFPYTPTLSVFGFGTAQLNRNSGRAPTIWTLDFRAAKAFWWGNMLYDFYVQVNNVLDRENCVQVFPTTGQCQLGTFDQSRRREGNTVSADAITSTLVDRPQYVGRRRTILAGVRISF
ncbi:MAG: TonB-dependent receptor [Gemmatimonadetes bacterium]|uniref:TonB-dependent receptor n=1 Tax=Candidatus Kutchimonas denitrificans TaxID=3056748 RepID=A0AAE5CB76_9BACT|nr:TonB-dependent receptor [Gemmatimonadota bacterium]NIR75452.1 TonB-dependent receptor [Candidatus Kutchimonas denitrificans]NIS01766.1 TonB-dependent receptor [Gemmatimonadota bacterium]NIT67547.1 TonB-dependent receptor [Gemmatimonadota bacterium]NIU53421.1 TonB-dependent receptor plug domain-containing protein [Gemmatimonadota bacterium]